MVWRMNLNVFVDQIWLLFENFQHHSYDLKLDNTTATLHVHPSSPCTLIQGHPHLYFPLTPWPGEMYPISVTSHLRNFSIASLRPDEH